MMTLKKRQIFLLVIFCSTPPLKKIFLTYKRINTPLPSRVVNIPVMGTIIFGARTNGKELGHSNPSREPILILLDVK